MFSVVEVIVHYKYKMLELKPSPEENGRDLALLRLDRDAVSAGLEPICLPPGRMFPDDVGIIKGESGALQWLPDLEERSAQAPSNFCLRL